MLHSHHGSHHPVLHPRGKCYSSLMYPFRLMQMYSFLFADTEVYRTCIFVLCFINTSETFPHTIKYSTFIPFNGCIVFHSWDIPPFIDSNLLLWTFRWSYICSEGQDMTVEVFKFSPFNLSSLKTKPLLFGFCIGTYLWIWKERWLNFNIFFVLFCFILPNTSKVIF